MSWVRLVFGRRVPLYVSLPVVATCGAAGFIVSAMQPGPIFSGGKQVAVQSQSYSRAKAPPAPVTTSAVEEPPSPNAVQPPLAEPSLPRDGSSVASLPAEEIDVPTRLTGAPAGVAQVAPAPIPAVASTARSVRAATQRTRAARAERPAHPAAARRSQPIAQQRVSAPPKSAGLKGLPLIGPVFSLLQ
jgi:hypothetical protein